ncbi:Protein MAIN-like 2 [Vitis vinifera]|uniref:Protein MAIN-like 2 n=1 Tax=Vitis vinifera TaxID=29760 RepID=A0A438IHC9_VITVI|nr:Protein MAIN-like 2 [Vitis vinifera]
MDLYVTSPGPIDQSVLYDQDKHVSSAVWEGQERGALRCHEHTSKLDQWALTQNQLELVHKAGFGYLRLIPAISLDNPLISALVERWRRETNTFHLNVGEMTCPEDAPMEEIERRTRAYLLYLVGSTIFSTTTGNKVPVMYLPLFENFDQASNYAWGAAALSFLYRALGNASLKSQSTVSGCLTLLQCWSYYHLDIGRPRLNQDSIHVSFPLVLKWKGKQSGPTANRDLIFYRKALDSLKSSDVEWLPYMNIDSRIIPEDIKSSLIVGRSKTMLICFDKAERHLPDRCLRQYGLRQSIPEEVQRWERKSRGVDGGVDLSGKMELELNEWLDRQLNIVEDDGGVEESEYMQWYLKITRRFVGRLIPLSSEFQRMHAALRDIAHLADTVSTQGMDSQQTESVTRIRIRGKEMIRRKSNGKRRRKDDPVQCHAASEGDQSQLCSAAGEIDYSQLCLTDAEVDDLHLCHAGGDGVDAQLHTTIEVDGTLLCHPTDEIDDTETCIAVTGVDDSQVCHAIIKGEAQAVPQSSLRTSEDVGQHNDCSIVV